MGGQLTKNEKWWLAAVVVLTWATIGDIGLTLHRAASVVIAPVLVGAVIGCAAWLVGFAIDERLRLRPRLVEFRSSLRWRGRHRWVDFLMFLVVYTIGFQVMQHATDYVPHAGDIFLGLLDGGVVTAIVIHVARRGIARPGTSRAA